MNDDQFSVIRHSALRDTLTAMLGVLIVLWLALRSWKIIVAVFFSLIVGLAATAAIGLAMVGSFNLISIAFFVLFVGFGVDFGIQFSVRYRSERHEQGRSARGLRSGRAQSRRSSRTGGGGHRRRLFFVSAHELSRPFGIGVDRRMRHADRIPVQHHLVPAMLALLNPPGEPAAVGFRSLAPLDDFLQRHRIAVVAGTILVVLAGTPLLLHLPFDFNPVDLQSSELAVRRDLS